MESNARHFHTAAFSTCCACLAQHGRKTYSFFYCLSLLCNIFYETAAVMEARYHYHNSKLKPESLFSSALLHLKISINPWQHPRRFTLPLRTQKTRFLCSVDPNPALESLDSYLSNSAFSITQLILLLLILPLRHIIHNILLRGYADDTQLYLQRKKNLVRQTWSSRFCRVKSRASANL